MDNSCQICQSQDPEDIAIIYEILSEVFTLYFEASKTFLIFRFKSHFSSLQLCLQTYQVQEIDSSHF